MKYLLLLLALIGCIFLGSVLVQAQSGGGYDLTWHIMDSGNGLTSGGDYSIQTTIGQPNAGETSGGDYGLQIGFWSVTQVEGDLFFAYLPTVIK